MTFITFIDHLHPKQQQLSLTESSHRTLLHHNSTSANQAQIGKSRALNSRLTGIRIKKGVNLGMHFKFSYL